MALPTDATTPRLQMAMAAGSPKPSKKTPPTQKTPGAMASTAPVSRLASSSSPMSSSGMDLSSVPSMKTIDAASVATVLAMDPSVLVFDEPTAGLDPRGRRELMAVMATRPETLLVSTHDLAMVSDALPRTVIVDDGVVVADGPSDQLLADDALLAAGHVAKGVMAEACGVGFDRFAAAAVGRV